MTKSLLYLRIAAVLTLIHCILHTVGGVLSPPPEQSLQAAVMATMRTTFVTMGATRSYADFLLGYGLFVTIMLLAASVIFWQLAALMKTHALQVQPILMTFCLSFIALAGVAARYFFWAPAITEVMIALCLALAFFSARTHRLSVD